MLYEFLGATLSNVTHSKIYEIIDGHGFDDHGERNHMGVNNLHYWKEYTGPVPAGFILWQGGDCPVDGDVEIMMRDGDKDTGVAYGFTWYHDGMHDDIIAYRIVEGSKEFLGGTDDVDRKCVKGGEEQVASESTVYDQARRVAQRTMDAMSRDKKKEEFEVKPGDWIDVRELDDEQYQECVEVFLAAGAIDRNLHAKLEVLHWYNITGALLSYVLDEDQDPDLKRQLTFEQLTGKDLSEKGPTKSDKEDTPSESYHVQEEPRVDKTAREIELPSLITHHGIALAESKALRIVNRHKDECNIVVASALVQAGFVINDEDFPEVCEWIERVKEENTDV